MFEGIIVNILNKYLGKYIQNLDTDNLKIGILDGELIIYSISGVEHCVKISFELAVLYRVTRRMAHITETEVLCKNHLKSVDNYFLLSWSSLQPHSKLWSFIVKYLKIKCISKCFI